MTLKRFVLLPLLLLCLYTSAQNDTIAQLDEVIISDTQLEDFSNTQSIQRLNDSVIRTNAPSLTALLQYNSVVYFKENGLGMVSSPSFRGTTAQQTAVLWNGININSQFNGLTDFNTVNTRDFGSISIKAGGGSVVYGSSAIGGSIHLNNDLAFGNKFENMLRLDYGSFNTFGAHYGLQAGTDRFSANVGITRNSSDNDYEYPGYDIKNENGQYYNTSFNTAFAYRVNEKNLIRFYSYAFDGERHFSRTLAAPSRSMYQNRNNNNLAEWTGLYGKFTSRLKAAYLYEQYKYFENYETGVFTFNEVQTLIARYDAAYAITEDIKLNAVLDHVQNKGKGSDIADKKRDITSGSLLMKHTVSNKLYYELGVRKEITDAYDSPVLFSLGTNINPFSFYTLKLNTSHNFRIPTFNDLYWQGSGNPNLKPETSYQAEISNELQYKGATLTITGYYIKIRDMLRWVPSQGGMWSPENEGRVNTRGLEAIFNWEKKIGQGDVTVTGTYAYTVSRKDGTNEQLIYVPMHRATAALAYARKNVTVYYRHMFNGEVFYTSDNLSAIDPYNVSSVGAEYSFRLFGGFGLGLQVNNLWGEEYQNVNVHPMPGRNYNMYLNFKF